MVQDSIIYIYIQSYKNPGKGSPLNPAQNENTQLQSKTDVHTETFAKSAAFSRQVTQIYIN